VGVRGLSWPSIIEGLLTGLLSSLGAYLLIKYVEKKVSLQPVAHVSPQRAVDPERERARLFLRRVSRERFLSLTPAQQRYLLRACPGELLKRFPDDEELQKIVDRTWTEVAATVEPPNWPTRVSLWWPLATGLASALVILIALRFRDSVAPSAWLLVALITWAGGQLGARAHIRDIFRFPRG